MIRWKDGKVDLSKIQAAGGSFPAIMSELTTVFELADAVDVLVAALRVQRVFHERAGNVGQVALIDKALRQIGADHAD